MSNLYKPNQQQQHQPVGSFDDYDSIVDEFQFPIDGNNSQYSDVSSMHMSEMGGVSVAAAANSPARSARSNVTPTRNTNIGGENEELEGGGNGVGSPLQFLPSHLVAVNNNNNNNVPTTRGGGEQLNNSTGNVSEGSSFKLDVDASGYYHVGDYRVGDLGIDTTDVSAILGVASDDGLDEESLLAHAAGNNGSSLPTVEDYKKSNVKKLSRKKNKNKMMSNSSRGDKYEVMNHQQQQQENGNVNHRSIGPLGDDLSYAEAPIPPNDEYQHDYDSDDDDEDEINEGILPNWIAFSSQKSKCIFVSSTALILGSLVLAIVALGVSYGTGSLLMNDSENNSNNNGGIESDGGGVSGVVVPPPTNGDTGGLVTTSTTIGPTLMPTPDALYLVTDAPVSSTTGEDGDNESELPKPTTTTTDSPTLEPTSIGTSPIDDTTATSVPTAPPRLEPSIVFVSPTVPAVPITTPPTLKLVDESSSSPITTETLTEAPISSTIIDNIVPSSEPTLSPVTPKSMIPSMNPTSKPSTSTKPSWSFGTESTNGGDVTFYLMADGGSNFRFWSEKLRVLNLEDDQKFMVHFGSAIRAVDNCESTAYLRTQLSLSVSPIPVYSLPGNNDYPECDDPIQGWANYEEHMMNLDTMYWNTTDEEYEYDVKRQTNIDRDENFSFLYKRVLFIGLNMVTNDIDEEVTAKRLDENINWVVDNVNAYSTNADVVFIMGYGRLMATENELFYNAMVNMTSSASEEEDGTGGVGGELSDKLLIYARRASETDIEYDIGGNSNFAELRVGNEWPILDVRIRTKGKDAPLVEYRDVVEDDEDEPKML